MCQNQIHQNGQVITDHQVLPNPCRPSRQSQFIKGAYRILQQIQSDSYLPPSGKPSGRNGCFGENFLTNT